MANDNPLSREQAEQIAHNILYDGRHWISHTVTLVRLITDALRIADLERRLDVSEKERLQIEKFDEEMNDAQNRTLEYARMIAGRRDVHSVEEVLDLIPTLRSQLAEAKEENKRVHALALQSHTEWLLYAPEADQVLATSGALAKSYIRWVNQAETIKKLESQLAEAKTALTKLFPIAIQGVPKRGHPGPCGPEAGCDGICMEVAAIAETLRFVREVLSHLEPALTNDGTVYVGRTEADEFGKYE